MMQRKWVPAQPPRVLHFDLDSVPETVWIDLCVMAIRGTAKAMATPEEQAAMEKHRQAYLDHLAQREKRCNRAQE